MTKNATSPFGGFNDDGAIANRTRQVRNAFSIKALMNMVSIQEYVMEAPGFARFACQLSGLIVAYETRASDDPFWFMGMRPEPYFATYGRPTSIRKEKDMTSHRTADLIQDGIERVYGVAYLFFQNIQVRSFYVLTGHGFEEKDWKLLAVIFEKDGDIAHRNQKKVEVLMTGRVLAEYMDVGLGLDLRVLYTSGWESKPKKMCKAGVQGHTIDFHNVDRYTWIEKYGASREYGIYRIPRHARDLMRQGEDSSPSV